MKELFYALTLALVGMSVVAYIAYAVDKKKAVAGAFRTRERTLLLLSALMGAPGALLAMNHLRHKTLHKKFTITVPLFLALQLILYVFVAIRAFT